MDFMKPMSTNRPKTSSGPKKKIETENILDLLGSDDEEEPTPTTTTAKKKGDKRPKSTSSSSKKAFDLDDLDMDEFKEFDSDSETPPKTTTQTPSKQTKADPIPKTPSTTNKPATSASAVKERNDPLGLLDGIEDTEEDSLASFMSKTPLKKPPPTSKKTDDKIALSEKEKPIEKSVVPEKEKKKKSLDFESEKEKEKDKKKPTLDFDVDPPKEKKKSEETSNNPPSVQITEKPVNKRVSSLKDNEHIPTPTPTHSTPNILTVPASPIANTSTDSIDSSVESGDEALLDMLSDPSSKSLPKTSIYSSSFLGSSSSNNANTTPSNPTPQPSVTPTPTPTPLSLSAYTPSILGETDRAGLGLGRRPSSSRRESTTASSTLFSPPKSVPIFGSLSTSALPTMTTNSSSLSPLPSPTPLSAERHRETATSQPISPSVSSSELLEPRLNSNVLTSLNPSPRTLVSRTPSPTPTPLPVERPKETTPTPTIVTSATNTISKGPPSLSQWQKWLNVDPLLSADKDLLSFAETGFNSSPPFPWEITKDGQYKNTLNGNVVEEHPLVANLREKVAQKRAEIAASSRSVLSSAIDSLQTTISSTQSQTTHSTTNLNLPSIITTQNSNNANTNTQNLFSPILPTTPSPNAPTSLSYPVATLGSNPYDQINSLQSQLMSSQRQIQQLEAKVVALTNEIAMNAKSHQQDLSHQQSQHDDKVQSLNNEILTLMQHHRAELEAQKTRYEERIKGIEERIGSRNFAQLGAENSLQTELIKQAELHQQQIRDLQETQRAAVQQIEQTAEQNAKAAAKRAREEIAYSLALHKDTLESKEKQFSEALESQRRLHLQEIAAIKQKFEQNDKLEGLVLQLQSSSAQMSSLQRRVDSEHQQQLYLREQAVLKSEDELRTKFEMIDQRTKAFEAETRFLHEEKSRLRIEAEKIEQMRSMAETERRKVEEILGDQKRAAQSMRDSTLREKEIFIAECLEERHSLSEERQHLQMQQRDIVRREEEWRKRLVEMESKMELEKSSIMRDRALLQREQEAIETTRLVLQKEREELTKEQQIFERETLALTALGAELERRSQEVQKSRQKAFDDHNDAMRIKQETDELKWQLEELKEELRNKEAQIEANKQALKAQRIEVSRERKKMVGEMIQRAQLNEEMGNLDGHLEDFEGGDFTNNKENFNTNNNNLTTQGREKPTNKTKEISTESTPQNPNAHNPTTPSFISLEIRQHLQKWNKERDEAQTYLDDQNKFLSFINGALVNATPPRPQMQRNTFQAQSLPNNNNTFIQQQQQQQQQPQIPPNIFAPQYPQYPIPPQDNSLDSQFTSLLKLSSLHNSHIAQNAINRNPNPNPNPSIPYPTNYLTPNLYSNNNNSNPNYSTMSTFSPFYPNNPDSFQQQQQNFSNPSTQVSQPQRE